MAILPPKRIYYKNEIEIRPFSTEDAKAIYQGYKDSVTDLKKFMAWAHIKTDFEKACLLYAEFNYKTILCTDIHFTGFDKKTSEFLFCSSLYPHDRLNTNAYELGYWVSSNHHGKGLGTLAAKAMIVLAFEYFDADRVSVRCNLDNEGSKAVIHKCGFKEEGIMRNALKKPSVEMVQDGYSTQRDTYLYSLLPEDLSDLDWYKPLFRDIEIITYQQELKKIAEER
ncbi:MAG: GNAT family protein [Chlamydiota bacterium]|jgi:RimJ/RimL family protein N-acetyltransferase